MWMYDCVYISFKFSVQSTIFARTCNLRVSYALRAADPSLLMEEDKFQPVKERTDKGGTIYGRRRSGTPDSLDLGWLG